MSPQTSRHRDLLHHRVDGEGSPVMLLHPVGLDLTSWEAVAERLASGFTVLRVDLRGHGDSSAPEGDFHLEDYADDVHRVLVETGLRPAAIVGLSFGGMIAQMLALRHPEDVSALVLAGTSSTQDAERSRLAVQRAEIVEQQSMTAVVEPTLQRWFTAEFLASGGAKQARERLLSDDPKGWAASWRAISQLDTGPHLPTIRVPTLCVAGERDLAIPAAAVQAIAAAIPAAKFVSLPAAPHMMQIETPAEFEKVIAAFLRHALPEPARARISQGHRR